MSNAQTNQPVNRQYVDRRDILRAGIGVTLTPGAVWASVARALADPAAPLDPNKPFVEFICDQTIPATDTAGALGARVPDFLFIAVAHGLGGSKGDEITRLRAEFEKAAGRDFMLLPPGARLELLRKLDTAAYGSQAGASTSAWPTIKRVMLMGYYSSEIGASKELSYDLVPGRFDPDVPYKKGDRAYSSDWIGVGL